MRGGPVLVLIFATAWDIAQGRQLLISCILQIFHADLTECEILLPLRTA
jgi:hypothetical protein